MKIFNKNKLKLSYFKKKYMDLKNIEKKKLKIKKFP